MKFLNCCEKCLQLWIDNIKHKTCKYCLHNNIGTTEIETINP